MALPPDEELRTLVDPSFRALRRTEALQTSSLRFTLPLPEPWPHPRGAVFFAYGTALPMASRDGRLVFTAMDAALVSHPFAAVWVLRGAPPVTRLLSNELTLAGTQGIGPAGPQERELSSRSAEVLAELEARVAGGEELSDVARRFFAQWGRSNGVIARCLPDDQRAFLAWTASPLS